MGVRSFITKLLDLDQRHRQQKLSRASDFATLSDFADLQEDRRDFCLMDNLCQRLSAKGEE